MKMQVPPMQTSPHLRHPLPLAMGLAASVCVFMTTLQAGQLNLEFQPMAASEPLKLDQFQLENAAGESWSVTRLSFLASGLALQNVAGEWLELPKALAWLDAAKNRHLWTVSDVPEGNYQALRFDVGLPPALNDADPAQWPAEHPLNPNLNGLHWSWQGGYIFLALEGRFSTTGVSTPKGYAYHLAREPFRSPVLITAPFEVRDQTPSTLPLKLEVTAMLDGARSLSFANDGSSTHSKDADPVAEALKANLATAFRPLGLNSVTSSPNQPRPPQLSTLPAKITPYRFTFNRAFPIPALPKDNPLVVERVELGRRLFHDPQLSRDGSISCASCHLAEAALSDPRPLSTGIEGRVGNRNAMPLFNLAWKTNFFWDGRATSLREQVLQPIQDHREMDESLDRVVAKLNAQADYRAAFEQAFGDGPITAEALALALENFLLTLLSHDSKFDRAMRGEETLTEQEQRGFDLFMTEREPRLGSLGGDCFHCHGGPLFTDHQFRNNGLAIDKADLGRFLASQSPIDRGAFSTPSLRNIALTAPYMHDGRFSTLEQVIDHYSEGVERTDTLDPNLAKHPDGGLHLDAEEKAALIAFLRTLTDDRFAQESRPQP